MPTPLPTPVVPRARRAGFTLAEIVVVIVLVGIAASIVVPRFILSPSQRAYAAARQLAADLETVRGRAAAAASSARVLFDPVGGAYDGYLDANRDGAFTYSGTERDSLGVFAGRAMEPPVRFGRGGRPAVPGFPEADAVSFGGAAVTFDPRGVLRPIGDRGVIYLRTDDSTNALAAVTVTGAGNVRVWRWQGSGWR